MLLVKLQLTISSLPPKKVLQIFSSAENISKSLKNILTPSPDALITTDASNVGWGAVFHGASTQGHWSLTEAEELINVLELQAILFGLEAFCNDLRSQHIRVQTDNTTAVAYVNNLGGVKSMECHKVAKAIWSWAIERQIHLSAEYLPGSQNTLADKASRVFDEKTE